MKMSLFSCRSFTPLHFPLQSRSISMVLLKENFDCLQQNNANTAEKLYTDGFIIIVKILQGHLMFFERSSSEILVFSPVSRCFIHHCSCFLSKIISALSERLLARFVVNGNDPIASFNHVVLTSGFLHRCRSYEDCCGTRCCVRALSIQRLWYFW